MSFGQFQIIMSYLGNFTSMDKYLTKRKVSGSSEVSNADSSKQSCVELNLPNLHPDLGMRTRILDYDPNIRDEVRRSYLSKVP